MINSRITSAISAMYQACQTFLNHLPAAILTVCLLTTGLTAGLTAALETQDLSSQELGRAVRQRVEQTDPTNRPKTTGEFLDEARGDVPLNERLENITRDSVEAFKQLGAEYKPDLKQTAQSLQDAAAKAGQDLTR